MLRPTIGVKLTAVAVGVVCTAGVAAAATIGSASPGRVAPPAAMQEQVLDAVPVDLRLPELTTIPELPTVSIPPLPSLPAAPALPEVPGTADLPVDPSALATTATAAINRVAALLPEAAALQGAVLDCVADLTALSPVPAASLLNPLGPVTSLLGSLGAAPAGPDPAVVQATIAGCVAHVMSVLPDPAGLAAALTTAFAGNLPGPVAGLVAQLTGGLEATPDAGQLLDLVTNLTGATGSPAAVVDQLSGALAGVVPAPASGLLSFPFAVVDQIFSTLGL
jgi:hypothetical protein